MWILVDTNSNHKKHSVYFSAFLLKSQISTTFENFLVPELCPPLWLVPGLRGSINFGVHGYSSFAIR